MLLWYYGHRFQKYALRLSLLEIVFLHDYTGPLNRREGPATVTLKLGVTLNYISFHKVRYGKEPGCSNLPLLVSYPVPITQLIFLALLMWNLQPFVFPSPKTIGKSVYRQSSKTALVWVEYQRILTWQDTGIKMWFLSITLLDAFNSFVGVSSQITIIYPRTRLDLRWVRQPSSSIIHKVSSRPRQTGGEYPLSSSNPANRIKPIHNALVIVHWNACVSEI